MFWALGLQHHEYSSDLGCDAHMLLIQSPTSVDGNVVMDEYNGKDKKNPDTELCSLHFQT